MWAVRELNPHRSDLESYALAIKLTALVEIIVHLLKPDVNTKGC
jgi:hypothetical protein